MKISRSDGPMVKALLPIWETWVQFPVWQISTCYEESFIFYLLAMILPNSARLQRPAQELMDLLVLFLFNLILTLLGNVAPRFQVELYNIPSTFQYYYQVIRNHYVLFHSFGTQQRHEFLALASTCAVSRQMQNRIQLNASGY